MNNYFDPQLQIGEFKLPPQDIQLLGFCESNKAQRVKQWVRSLKVTMARSTMATLYQALPEILHLKTDPQSRFEMLEECWHVIQQGAVVLSKDYLQQPLLLPPAAQKTALLCQALQKNLVDGYTICIRDLVGQKKLKPPQLELLQHCLFRGQVALSQFILRSSQLYSPLPPKMWLRAHFFYQTAEHFELLKKPVSISKRIPHRTLLDAYTQLMAFASISPNQLSQNDIQMAYSVLEGWSKFIVFFPSQMDDKVNTMRINLMADMGPQAKIRFSGKDHERSLEIDFQGLLTQLENSKGPGEELALMRKTNTVTVPPEMPFTLLAHMMNGWSNEPERNQSRKRTDIAAEACIGIIDCHYHISGGVEFSHFLSPEDALEAENSFLSSSLDDLMASIGSKKKPAASKSDKKSIFNVLIQNISSGGYCIKWQGDLPNRIEAGEMIGIREQGRRSWSIGVIRWIRQTKNTTHIGTQLLCSQPVPYGASVTMENGLESVYMRVIHIPSPIAPDQPPSLLTTTIPFQEGRRVELKQADHSQHIRLGKPIFFTSKMKLFEFLPLSPDGEP